MNWWQQNKNPIDEIESGQKYVEGYKRINIGAPSNTWGGLCRTKGIDEKSTYINGTPSSSTNNWFFAIGMYQGAILGHYNLPSNNEPTNIVYIWVKMPERQIKTNFRCNTNNHFPLIIIFILCL